MVRLGGFGFSRISIRSLSTGTFRNAGVNHACELPFPCITSIQSGLCPRLSHTHSGLDPGLHTHTHIPFYNKLQQPYHPENIHYISGDLQWENLESSKEGRKRYKLRKNKAQNKINKQKHCRRESRIKPKKKLVGEEKTAKMNFC